jgi:hypothetical protein
MTVNEPEPPQRAGQPLEVVRESPDSTMLFAVLSTCFRAATGYDRWWHATVSGASGEALLRKAA